jgi:rhamnulokinase
MRQGVLTMSKPVHLGIDLGAESGRVIAGLWNGKSLRLEELHRFPNGPVPLAGTLRWDVLRLWAEVQNGLALAGKKYGRNIVSVGADTWAWTLRCCLRTANCSASLFITGTPGQTA